MGIIRKMTEASLSIPSLNAHLENLDREIVPLLTVKPKSRRKWVARVTESSSPVVSFTSPGWAETSGYFLAGKGNMGKDTESGAGLVLVRPERVSALDHAERLSDPF